MNMIKKRNEKVDIVRGFAILIVVLGHIITGIFISPENSFIYKAIWSVQMPLFMILGGYVNCLSQRKINTLSNFIVYLKDKTFLIYIHGFYGQ